jgi:hypothetical protein
MPSSWPRRRGKPLFALSKPVRVTIFDVHDVVLYRGEDEDTEDEAVPDAVTRVRIYILNSTKLITFYRDGVLQAPQKLSQDDIDPTL